MRIAVNGGQPVLAEEVKKSINLLAGSGLGSSSRPIGDSKAALGIRAPASSCTGRKEPFVEIHVGLERQNQLIPPALLFAVVHLTVRTQVVLPDAAIRKRFGLPCLCGDVFSHAKAELIFLFTALAPTSILLGMDYPSCRQIAVNSSLTRTMPGRLIPRAPLPAARHRLFTSRLLGLFLTNRPVFER